MWEIKNGILQIDGTAVEQIRSSNIGGSFANKPTIAVIHFTAGGSARSSAQWFASQQNTNSSAHVVIERDGTIIQCVDFRKIAWHAGKSSWRGIAGLNKCSIGIELANYGYLRSAGSGWATPNGKAIADPVIATHRNGNPDGSRHPIGWEPFPEEQFESALKLVELLIATYGIAEVVGHDDIAPVRKSDPGPAFNMARFRSRLFDSRSDASGNTGRVTAVAGLNLRSGPGTGFAVVTTLADGSPLELLGIDGNWLQVSVLDAKGNAIHTGWVHSHYVRQD